MKPPFSLSAQPWPGRNGQGKVGVIGYVWNLDDAFLDDVGQDFLGQALGQLVVVVVERLTAVGIKVDVDDLGVVSVHLQGQLQLVVAVELGLQPAGVVKENRQGVVVERL